MIAYFSPLWEPLINVASKVGWRMPQPKVSLISSIDFVNIMDLTEFEPIRMETRQLIPFNLFGIGRLVNRFIAPLPGIQKLLAGFPRGPFFEGTKACRIFNQHSHSLSQRARKHRACDQGNAAVRRCSGNHLCRRTLDRRTHMKNVSG